MATPLSGLIERVVRASAGASRNESEFIAKLGEQGLQYRPRYAEGGRSKVVGYSVKLAGEHDHGRAVWYGGGRLARDLTLPADAAGDRTTARRAARWTSGAQRSDVTRRSTAERRAELEERGPCAVHPADLAGQQPQLTADQQPPTARSGRPAASENCANPDARDSGRRGAGV